MSNEHILVVDDEPFNLKIIRASLSDDAYQLDLAEDGKQAWDRLQDANVQYDLIVLDRMMPGMDGLTLLKKLKQEPRYRNTPVIMQTAAAAPEQVAEGLAAGAYYYLTKPYEPDALRVIVKSALETRTQSATLEKIAKDCATVRPLLTQAEFHFRTLAEANALVAQFSQLCPIPELAAMGLSELLINAVEHGNLELSYADKTRLKWEDGWELELARRLSMPAYRERMARVYIAVEPDEIVFTIQDQGPGFEWEKYLEFSPDRAFDPNGRGIAMARSLSFSAIEYQGSGNTVVARVKREP